ncbi:MAG: ABC transporter permease [Gaiellaceae bacterium]
MKVLVIAGNGLRRLVRWRMNIFFVFILPMLIILLLGMAFGSQGARIGVVGGTKGPLARQLVRALHRERSLSVRRYASEGDLTDAVSRGRVEAGIVIPSGYDSRLAAGKSVALRYVARPDQLAQQLRTTVDSVVAGESGLVGAAQLDSRLRKLSFSAALARARAVSPMVPRIAVELTAADGGAYPAASGRFDTSASTQLLLFIFITSLNGAIGVIESRRLGVFRRMLSTPTSVRTVLCGVLLGRLAVALFQSAIIVLGASLVFGVSWGSPPAAGLVILSFCLLSTGAAVLLGALVSSEQQAAGLAMLLGLGLASLGGSMAPLEVFPPLMRKIAHITPHAWANDAFGRLLNHHAGVLGVLPDVGVLVAGAAVLVTLGTLRLRRSLVA